MHPKLSPWEEIKVHSLVLLALQARLLRLDSNFPGNIQLLCPSSRLLNSHLVLVFAKIADVSRILGKNEHDKLFSLIKIHLNAQFCDNVV